MNLNQINESVLEKIFGYSKVSLASISSDHAALRNSRNIFIWKHSNKEEVSSIPNFCSNISDAWKIVEEFQNRNYLFSLELSNYSIGEWVASFSKYDSVTEKSFNASLAICLAALKSIE